eukprot:gene10834-14544_t
MKSFENSNPMKTQISVEVSDHSPKNKPVKSPKPSVKSGQYQLSPTKSQNLTNSQSITKRNKTASQDESISELMRPSNEDIEGKGVKTSEVNVDVDKNPMREPHSPIRPPSQAIPTKKSSTSLVQENTKVTRDSKPVGNNNDKLDKTDRFVGPNMIQYGLWAHYLSYGSAIMAIVVGSFAISYNDATTYKCHIYGETISSNFLYKSDGTCPTLFNSPSGKVKDICCNPNSASMIRGFSSIGAIYVLYAIFTVIYENTYWGFGLWFPKDTFFHRNRISPIGILHFIIGIIGITNYVTFLGGSFYLTNGVVYQYAAIRFETGDGGREQRRKELEKMKNNSKSSPKESYSKMINDYFQYFLTFNPITFYKRIRNEDKLSSYVWTFIFLLINFITFVSELLEWYDIVESMEHGLLAGTLDVSCNTIVCKTNRKAVRYGPISIYAAWAKACGMCLNLNGMLILLPVTRLVLTKINNAGVSFSNTQQTSDWFARFFAHPLTRYLPLQKNVEFHKMCALAIFFFGWGHMIFHMIVLKYSAATVLEFFRFARFYGTDYLTGAVVTYAMFMIYTSAHDIIRMTKYEIFFYNHQIFFTVFFLFMFLHGNHADFFIFAIIPVTLYCIERYLRTKRGNHPFVVVKVEWIPPVMAVYFRPVFKEHFPFKEGQYLYLNCPYISNTEWHPFTISSASDDLNFGPRIHLETGEEVMEVPRPSNLPPNVRWSKYCLVSKDWTKMDPNDYIEKGDTGYNDYVSVHIKVHGLDEPKARTWTRKLKEYFELLSPGRKFPYYFSSRDARGEVTIGRLKGPDGQQLLRVDGPHAAPSEHYTSYGTVMLIGAGIGLTPCASVLAALTKYRWKKNFNPELLHFYWLVRQSDVDSFQWLVHMLSDLSFELKKGKTMNQIEKRYYCEINIYITGVEKEKKEVAPLYKPRKRYDTSSVTPAFTADDLYALMVNPTVDSKNQVKKMKEPHAENRLQDIWVWNGRPNWNEIFKEMKNQRQHRDIGVCFCGAPVIGADLKEMCEKYSSIDDDCLFSLHKENF